MDTVQADSSDHDLIVGISDDSHFVSLHQTDQTNYHNLSPCCHLEGDKDGIFLKNLVDINGPLVSSRTFTSEAKIQIRPNERWGSCHTENDGGYTNTVNYQHHLDLSKGLYLEVYRGEAHEICRIKYMSIDTLNTTALTLQSFVYQQT